MNARWMWTLGLVAALAACGADTETSAEDDAETGESAVQDAQPTPEEMAQRDAPPPEAMAAEDTAAETDDPEPGADEEARRYDRLYTIQIAAYLRPDEAESLASRLQGRGLPIWLSDVTLDGRSWTRVRLGASPDLAETRDLGGWIEQTYESDVWVAPVDQDAESVPTDAVDLTRRFLSSR